ncbi:hypothetical protein EIP91_004126, partial [Steccherinum ochraceum]
GVEGAVISDSSADMVLGGPLDRDVSYCLVVNKESSRELEEEGIELTESHLQHGQNPPLRDSSRVADSAVNLILKASSRASRHRRPKSCFPDISSFILHPDHDSTPQYTNFFLDHEGFLHVTLFVDILSYVRQDRLLRLVDAPRENEVDFGAGTEYGSGSWSVFGGRDPVVVVAFVLRTII